MSETTIRESEALALIERVRSRPAKFKDAQITMAHGAGGKATQTLVAGLFLPAFGGEALRELGDAGIVDGLALTTDSFVVKP
ncbi:MAG: hydrogenase expression/formation protein HypE, partial [Gaiellaceae bacterium]